MNLDDQPPTRFVSAQYLKLWRLNVVFLLTVHLPPWAQRITWSCLSPSLVARRRTVAGQYWSSSAKPQRIRSFRYKYSRRTVLSRRLWARPRLNESRLWEKSKRDHLSLTESKMMKRLKTSWLSISIFSMRRSTVSIMFEWCSGEQKWKSIIKMKSSEELQRQIIFCTVDERFDILIF